MTSPFLWTTETITAATDGQYLCGQEKESFAGVFIDSRHVGDSSLFVAIKGQHHDGHAFIPDVLEKGVRGVVAEKAAVSTVIDRVKHAAAVCVAVENTVEALGDMARYQRRRINVPVVAITGTNGKTTTKEMISLVLGRRYNVHATTGNLNNEIGVPLTLLKLNYNHETAVIELGMNAPGEIRRLTGICEPNIGVLLNVGSGHLAGVGSIDGVARAKAELLEILDADATAVMNADDTRVMKIAKEAGGKVMTYGFQNEADVTAENIVKTGAGLSFNIRYADGYPGISVQLPHFGDIMVSNALAAAAVGRLMAVSHDDIKAGLERFSPAPGRMNILETRKQFYIIDDTYNANPGSMAAAISGMQALKGENRGIMVVGDMFELGDYAESMHEETGRLAAQFGINMLYATGEFADAVAQGAMAAGMPEEFVFTGTKAEITRDLKSVIRAGDWVLVKGSRGMNMETVVAKIQAHGNTVKSEG
ncbi:MAG: UDP-N-acetylmuramoyl-tripeptide--D-alanyl-D-alanine ligase [Thermodesulfobacteriota bacterium]|nr:UDP-N-acetylmuramoyl-tripeptide--D-alanyl-D-alanine ligase [Thermodesulfobacteriota bacterium]